ncbi:phage tail tape measure protein [Campylobacter mucosalis]|uniref:Phage tail tape measure protein, TP901 family n=1 Tax=Campylobacter mucosalis CCUG 21559 TaxID=1032067 RepID=A0A6G5QFI2_9BACT|nr:phage tail tape measure protein [Campylobacter mucosalis]QCD44473.1 phage tail tape measure protein, TP901 family [Campylobacter mucosalis CCUG 21559]
MARNPTLTFGMDLSDFNKALKAINRQSADVTTQITKSITQATQAYKNGLKDLKLDPFNTDLKAKVQSLKTDIIKATSAEVKLKMDKAKAKIANLKGEIIAAVGSVAAVSLPIKTAIDFESSMADVKKVVDFKTPQELTAFSNEILKMSQTIPMTANGLIQVAAAGAQMGLAKDEILTFTDLAAKTAVAFDITADQAGDSIGKIKNILGLNIKETGEMMDVINHLSNKNAAKASQIVEVMKRIGGIGKQVGITKEQTAALATSFIALGKAPETAATASEALLKKLNNIGALSPNIQNAFEATGLSIKKFQKRMQTDAQGAVIEFLETMQKIKPQKRGELLTAIMGTNYDSDVATLISGIDVYKNALKEVSDKSNFLGSNEAEFKARSQTTANSIQTMQNSLNALSIHIGNIFLPYINKAIMAITGVINKISKFIANNTELVKNLGLAVGGLMALKTAFLVSKVATAAATFSLNGYRQMLMLLPIDCLKLSAGLKDCNLKLIAKNLYLKALITTQTIYQKTVKLTSLSFTTLLSGIKSAVMAFRALSLAMITNPIGLFVSAIVAGGALIYKYWDYVRAFFVGLKQGLAPLIDTFSNAFNAIKTAFSPIISLFSSFFSQSEATKEGLEGLTSAGLKFGNVVANALNLVIAPLKFVLDLITQTINGINTIFDEIKKLDVVGGVKELFGAGDGVKRSWYNPLNLFYNDEITTKGAIDELKANKAKNNQTNTNQNTINDNKTINITMQNSNATPVAVAKAVKNSSYSYGD